MDLTFKSKEEVMKYWWLEILALERPQPFANLSEDLSTPRLSQPLRLNFILVLSK